MTDRKDARGLPLTERFKLVRHQCYAALNYQRRAPLSLQEVDGYCRISAPDGSMFCPSPRRWRYYKRGLTSRLYDLDIAYLFTALDPPPGPVLDVGAYIGEFSLLALKWGRPVYAVDSDPNALVCLRRNLADRESLTVIDALVWNAEEDLTFGFAALSADSSVFVAETGFKTTGTVRRRATTLDRIAEDNGIDALAFLKCDVEGAEPEALEGGRDLLRRTARIAIDTGPERKGGRTSAACEALLRDAGFAVRTRERGRIVTYGSRGDLPG
ncbi:MAG: FkbM family methyltransferase [Rhodospirillaceae bacterium]|nr:FkbM family methyltransferase [Rhodospirillaceae bacterium]MYB12693.1 FkbM family methyltransferase [Rhodospirillaceae bacterium]MYI49404.1 FkbM family methyltransferase [Rhodospirillaceae bacterium]